MPREVDRHESVDDRRCRTIRLWKYIKVRGLFLFLRESIHEGTQWVVFEPKDDQCDRPAIPRAALGPFSRVVIMDSCVFCQIIAGELPSSPVLDSDLVVAFLDIHPWNPGHTLVLPRRHVESFTDLRPMEVEQLALCGQRIATALKQGLDGCEAVTFSLADGAAAGQDVPHTHLHVVPRRTGDGLGWRAAGQLQDRETLDATASHLRSTLGVSSRVG